MINSFKKLINKNSEDILGNQQKNTAESQIRHIKDIIQKDLNRLRIDLSANFLTAEYKNNITETYIRHLHTKLAPLFSGDNEKKAIFATHQENFEHFLLTGDIKIPLNLRDEESQFFWGTVLALYAAHPEIAQKWDTHKHNPDISQSVIWRRIASSSYMQRELQRHSAVIENSLNNPNAKIVWSAMNYPNINYCFIPDKNLIIDDMLWTLVVGVDAASTALGHEIAHSQGTQFTRSPRMEQIVERQNELIKKLEAAIKANDNEAYRKAAKEASRLKVEFEYRFRFFDELENMYANRFAINFGGEYDAAHLNELETDINVGQKYTTPQTLEEAEKLMNKDVRVRIQHVKDVARNSFFVNNKLISEHKIEEWHALHLYPELLSGTDANGQKMNSAESFERIREICNKFETSQPSPKLKSLNAKIYQTRMTSMSKRRAAMVDEFFDLFVAQYMDELYKQAEKDIDNQMNNQSQQNQQQSDDQGNLQQSQQQSSDQGNLQQQNQQQSDDQDDNQDTNMSSFPSTEQFHLPDTDKQYRPQISNEKAEEILSEAEDIKELLEKMQAENEKNKETTDSDKDKQSAVSQNQQVDNDDEDDKGEKRENLEDFIPQNDYPTLVEIEQMKKPDLDKNKAAHFYREGNWDEYQKYIAQYTNEIAQAKKMIAKIIKQNKLNSIHRGQEKIKNKMTKLPIQGGRSIDLQRHIALEQKIRQNDPNITSKDLERFRTQYKYSEDEIIKEIEIPQSNFGILIDGSGSMTGKPFDNALAISCILYEAARSFKEINVYIYMMGEPTPLTVALPDDKTKIVAKRLESVRKGQGGCNDHLIPAVSQFLDDVAQNMVAHPHKKSGFTHIFSVTDGGNNDYREHRNGKFLVNQQLQTMLEKNEQITFDCFFIDGGWRNYTKPFIEEMKKQGSTQTDYVDHIDDPSQISIAITNMLKKRMKHSQIKSPMTNGIKQKLIAETLKDIKRRRR
ncbi:MAG: hypothetical protein NC218_10735 [Acetobacter sp.]|nr:hypothetical protein [Acetobacter sp.]